MALELLMTIVPIYFDSFTFTIFLKYLAEPAFAMLVLLI